MPKEKTVLFHPQTLCWQPKSLRLLCLYGSCNSLSQCGRYTLVEYFQCLAVNHDVIVTVIVPLIFFTGRPKIDGGRSSRSHKYPGRLLYRIEYVAINALRFTVDVGRLPHRNSFLVLSKYKSSASDTFFVLVRHSIFKYVVVSYFAPLWNIGVLQHS